MSRFYYFMTLFTLLTLSTLKAQVPDVWYFGRNAKLSFSAPGPPVAGGNSYMNTPAGCAVDDTKGFYSNGNKIWRAGNNWASPTIHNGKNLKGDILSTQPIVFAKALKSDTVYAFTTDAGGGPDGLRLSVITHKPGYGAAVYKKNIMLLPRVSEKLSVALHCNKRDYWVLAHGWNNNKFYCYKVNDSVLEPTPVVTSIGSVHSGAAVNAAGYMKISMHSDKVALAITGKGLVELFRFDDINGTLDSAITIGGISNPYGVEFDYDGQMLYVSAIGGQLYQFDVSVWDSAHIANSKYLLSSTLNLYGALQLAPNQKIYLAVDNAMYLGVINFPQSQGSAANFVLQGIYLNGKRSEAGLPPIHKPTSLFDTKGSKVCFGDTTKFKILGNINNIDSVYWDFGDSLSNTDTSTLLKPFYVYPNGGVYKFTLIIYHCNEADTLRNLVEVLGPPYPNLGPDTSICDNVNYTLFGGYASTYLWQDGFTGAKYKVKKPGKYWVVASNKCGSGSDTVIIKNVFTSPKVTLPLDTVICEGDHMSISTNYDTSFTVVWNDSIVANPFIIDKAGIYKLEVTDTNGCRNKDDIVVGMEKAPKPDLGNDTTICYGHSVTFNGNCQGKLLWNNGSTSPTLTANQGGKYYLTATNMCGSVTDTVELTIAPCEHVIWVPSAFTPNGDGKNDVFIPYVENLGSYSLMIFNRWGQLVFQSENPGEGWDGTYKGRQASEDSYVWKIVYSDFYKNKYVKYGYVILYR